MRSQPNSDHRLSLHVESLEDRRMLAGNVNVAVNSAGDITITGDNGANSVVLGQSDFGNGPVTHLRAEGDTQITFNGSTSNFHYLAGSSVDSSVKVNLRGGGSEDTLMFDPDRSLPMQTGFELLVEEMS